MLIQYNGETTAYAVEHCKQITELQSNRIIGDVVFGLFADRFYNGEGYAAWLRGYLLDQNKHLVLDRHAEPVSFYVGDTSGDWADDSSEYKSIERVWKLDDTTLFWEHIDPWQIPGATYNVLRLSIDGEFIKELTVEGYGIDGIAKCYVKGELTSTLPYMPGNLEALRGFLLDVDVDFGTWDEAVFYNVENHEYDRHNRVVRARPLGEDVKLLLDTEHYEKYTSIVRPNDEVMNRFYRPENVREITIMSQDARLPIIHFLDELQATLPSLKLTSTAKWLDDDSTWKETYVTGEGCELSISCYTTTGEISKITFDDTPFYNGRLYQDSLSLFQISDSMQCLINTIAATDVINLDRATREQLTNLDLAHEGGTLMQNDFESEFDSSVTISGITIQVYKILQLGGENYHSSITISFPE